MSVGLAIEFALFAAGVFLGWLVWTAVRTRNVRFPVLELRTRTVSKATDSNAYWLAVAMYTVWAIALVAFALRAI
jgi:hypothetical protein